METNTARNWSPYQQAIFSFVETGKGSAIIEAVAGSGKSTTIVECFNRVRGSSLFLAFNKSIADELKKKGVNARTFHSLTFSAVKSFKKFGDITSNKLTKLIDENFTVETSRMYGTFMRKLVGLAKNNGIGCLVEDTEQAWVDIVNHHDIELDDERAVMGDAINFSRQLLALSNKSSMVDFDDLLYLAVLHGLVLGKFNFIFVDEAQDTNPIQRAILRKIMGPFSRMFAVGDPAQAIYGFRGSDSEAMNAIADEFQCTRLPLTVSYRCPVSVVEYARQWVSHIEPAPNAEAGEVIEAGMGWKHTDFQPNDLVICRASKPLVALAYGMLKRRMPVRIMGKEIGESLVRLVNQMNASSLDILAEKLRVWSARESEKALSKKNETKAEQIRDRADAILCLIEGMPENQRNVWALVEVINKLFADGVDCTVLATIHKAKGLEADRVFWLNRSLCPSMRASQEWQRQQEINLCYVATTRAKRTLFTIEEKKGLPEDAG